MQVPKSRKSLFFLRIEQIFQQMLHLATVRQQDCDRQGSLARQAA
jgi:hypothetical protein